MPAPSSLLSARYLGGHNRAKVLRALVERGPSPRSDLARLAGVTRATIGSIVQGLIDDGILEEHDPTSRGRVGKPVRPLWFADGAGTVAAIELTAGGVRGALVEPTGRRRHPVDLALSDPTDPAAVHDRVHAAVAALTSGRTVIGIGISVPGACDTATGEVIGSVQVPGAIGTELASNVNHATGIDVRIDNDTRAQALAEHWFGYGREIATFASVQTGDGIGAGLVIDGHVHRGPNAGNAEVGHTTVALDGDRCPCGQHGCWETVASLRWLRAEAQRVGLPDSNTIDAARLTALLAPGEQRSAARALLDRYADHLAIGLVNLFQTLGIDTFVLHGDAVGGGEVLLERIRAATRRRASSELDIRVSTLADATVLGAAGAVLSDLLHAAPAS